MVELILAGLWETLYMTLISAGLSYVIGLPLGMILAATDRNGVCPLPVLNAVLGFIVNVLRSIPFLLLMIALFGFTKFIVGTNIGSTAAIVPLVVSAAPFVARMTESSFKEVDPGVIEAARSMGAPSRTILFKVLLPEAKPSLIMGAAVSTITILGYSAMAGICGGGGLGDIAIRYGYYRYDTGTMWILILILVILVQILQEIGMKIAKITDNRI
ncbi:MAG: methionine ABC transporter permease [Anaerovoracaceae bacterium]|nr:methionine ABC transporter permease [Anaerovoracaceae bacterium]